MKTQGVSGLTSLHIVEGKLARCDFFGLSDSNDSPKIAAPMPRRRTFVSWLKTWAPIFAALSGNGGIAVSAAWQETYQNDVLARMDYEADQVKNPSTWSYANLRELKTHTLGEGFTITGKNGKIIGGKLPVEVEIDGSTYRGYLGGQCFEAGDSVAAVVDRHGRLLALSSPDRSHIVMDYTCHDAGFAALVHTLWVAWKMLTLIFGAFTVFVLGLGMAIEFGLSNPFAWLVALIGAPVGMGILMALILVFRLSLLDFWPAWRTSSVFHALGRPDLAKAVFDLSGEKVGRDGRVERDGNVAPFSIGRVYYSDAPARDRTRSMQQADAA